MTKARELAKLGEVMTNSQIGGRRNIIINGAMQVAQRATTQINRGNNDEGYYTVDRFRLGFGGSTAGRLTMSQVADVHDGFANALKLDCTTADTSIASNEFGILSTRFEGQDLQQLKKGTSEAEAVTVSFYVKGNANATYALELYDSVGGRHASQLFNVTTSWNRIVLTFNGDTTDSFADSNALALEVNIWFHAGSNFTSGTISADFASADNTRRAVGISSFFDSTDRTFFLTGLQMEIGSQATPFEHRSFGEELALCHRYFQAVTYENGGTISVGIMYANGSSAIIPMDYKGAKMRVAPTITMPSTGTSTSNVALLTTTSSYPSTIGSHTASNISVSHYSIRGASYSGLGNAGTASWFYNNGDVVFQYDSEL
tara:strand:+ start:816 stop:1934 length:1119 start_codon:yes stop_codon:yes gene_type:complete